MESALPAAISAEVGLWTPRWSDRPYRLAAKNRLGRRCTLPELDCASGFGRALLSIGEENDACGECAESVRRHHWPREIRRWGEASIGMRGPFWREAHMNQVREREAFLALINFVTGGYPVFLHFFEMCQKQGF
jgi:hypothetical protein